MKIFVDGKIFELQATGGISRYVSNLVSELQTLDGVSEIELVLSEPNRGVLPDCKIQRNYLPLSHKFGHYFRPINSRLFDTYVGSLNSGVMHSSYFRIYPQIKIPIVVTVYDMIYEKFPKLYCLEPEREFVEQKRKSIEQAKMVICISESVRKDVIEYYGLDPQKVVAIPLGVDGKFWRKRESKLPASIGRREFFLFVGKRSKHKNFEVLVKALPQIENMPLVVCAGGGKFSENEIELMKTYKVVDNFLSLPHLSDEELVGLYSKALALITPSLDEGFGLPVLEAMACECPVIVSDIGVFHEIAEKVPYYFDPTDEKSLASAIKKRLMDENVSVRLTSGKKMAKTYTWSSTAEKTLDVYRTLVDEKNSNN